MIETIDKAIKDLAKKIDGDIKADEALKYTQAALNLAHVKVNIAAYNRESKE